MRIPFFGRKKEKPSWHEGRPYKYAFSLGEQKVEISADIPIRNYETFLKNKDVITECGCGQKLADRQVSFSINGSGRVIRRSVKYCRNCDGNIPDYSSLIWTIDGELVSV